MNFDTYFETKGKSVIFKGDLLEIFVPIRYSQHKYLDIINTVSTIGVFDMTINKTIETGYLLGAVIEIIPSDITTVTIGKDKFVKLILNKNDVFIKDTNVIKDQKISYVLFYEIFLSGHYPKFLTYNDCISLFDMVSKANGDTFSSDHMIFEMIISILFRDKNNLPTLYRYTDMNDGYVTIPLRTIAHVAQSTTGKIMGSYMNEGLDAAIVNAGDAVPNEIEDLLRV
jgi:hypothetical protein